MSNVKFNYKGKTLEVQCNPEDKLTKICSKFASKINEPVESKIYIYNNQLLNLEKTLSEQLSEIKGETEVITIYVNDIAKNDNVLIKYNFNGVEEEIKVKKEDNFLEIIQKLIQCLLISYSVEEEQTKAISRKILMNWQILMISKEIK